LGNLKDEVFERCAKALYVALSYYRGPDREPGGVRSPELLRVEEKYIWVP
jgi:hypothetical protein